MEILECKPKCCYTYWNTWMLVFKEKNQRQKQYKNDNVFLWDRSLTRHSGWQAFQMYWLLPQKKWEGKVPAFRYNRTILNLSNPISPLL